MRPAKNRFDMSLTPVIGYIIGVFNLASVKIKKAAVINRLREWQML